MSPEEARRLADVQGPSAQPPRPAPRHEHGGPRGLGEQEERRRRLAEAQGRVVAALVAGAEVPEGFDPERMRAQALSLIAKRRAIVARIRPDAAQAAGPDLAAEFAAYAAARATPPPGYRADADDFAAWLRERGRMPGDPAPRRRWWSRLPGRR
ncbi:hypothetical protein [Nonomuraea rubra]|uniref:SCO6045-like C-terminal domain-containing protein n=1 Tax=Nonomuraea rubra TaxID=46180 RepID=A0A7X0NMC8_9ACTN|nr:hypothetical protein [Nonomuraea rubra]MBB6546064.1 hypothetical protein [Nonomuraea rubra]